MSAETLDLLARSFEMHCDCPNVTLVVLLDEQLYGVDADWFQDTQVNILDRLLAKGAIAVGWLLLDENLDPVGLVPLVENPDMRLVLVHAVYARTGRKNSPPSPLDGIVDSPDVLEFLGWRYPTTPFQTTYFGNMVGFTTENASSDSGSGSAIAPE